MAVTASQIKELEVQFQRGARPNDPAADGPEIHVLRIHSDRFYDARVKQSVIARLRENNHIFEVEREFCKKVGL
jgi:hypothetical protein